MIALETLSAFSGLLQNLDEFAQADTIRLNIEPYDESLEDDPNLQFLSPGALPPDPARAAVIGVIDDTVPFANQRLTVNNLDSRMAAIWMQDGAIASAVDPRVGADLPHGTELRGAQISRMLVDLAAGDLADEEAIYRKAGVIDFSRGSVQSGAFFGNHGAAVADLAAGFAPSDADARNFPVMAVSLPPEVTRDTLGTFAPFYILTAILYLVRRTRRLCRWIEKVRGDGVLVRLPLIVNISYGILAGAKDGSSLVEQFQDAVTQAGITDIGPVHFVLPMGNHRQSQTHAALDTATDDQVTWEAKPDDKTPSFLEFWGPWRDDTNPPAQCMQLSISRQPSAPVTTGFAAHGAFEELQNGDAPVGRAYLQYRRTNGGGREVITLAMYPTLPAQSGDPYIQPGHFQMSVSLGEDSVVDAYIQRDDSIRRFRSGGRQSKFRDPFYQSHGPAGDVLAFDPSGSQANVMRAGTVNAFACGGLQLRVGGTYGDEDDDLDEEEREVVVYSGLGAAGLARPITGDTTAPADRGRMRPGVVTMGSLSGSRQAVSGTSMSAPQVTRALARRLASGDPISPVTPANIDAILRGTVVARTAGPQNTKINRKF